MLTILGQSRGGYCDGVSRRSFLRIGGLAMGGLTLPGLLRAESQPGAGRSHKSLIMIFLPGGPPHQDMWDIKTEAPSEIRGEFSPIKTKVPGIEVGELFPRMAGMMDKLTVIRSVVGSIGHHDAFQCLTGRSVERQPAGGWPCIGSVLSHLHGPVDRAIPPAFGLSLKMGHAPWADNGKPGFLGLSHAPFTPEGDQLKADMVLNGVTLERLRNRRALLGSFDNFRRTADSQGAMSGLDEFQKQAFDVLTSSRLVNALDLEKEDPKLRDRYGRGSSKRRDDGGPELLDQFMLARRLVEAGARCVTLGFNRWDWHGANFKQAREVFPMLDQGVTALVEDLHLRGMDKDVTVIVWGEFGRTPQINKDAGRDHWPNVSCAMLACGGLRNGQVIGSTDRLGGEVKDRPVHFQEIFATLYQSLGINPHGVHINDFSGRPHYLVDLQYNPIRELV